MYRKRHLSFFFYASLLRHSRICRARIVVENTFEWLKAWWCCVLKRNNTQTDNIPYMITATCVLRNIHCKNSSIFYDYLTQITTSKNENILWYSGYEIFCHRILQVIIKPYADLYSALSFSIFSQHCSNVRLYPAKHSSCDILL